MTIEYDRFHSLLCHISRFTVNTAIRNDFSDFHSLCVPCCRLVFIVLLMCNNSKKPPTETYCLLQIVGMRLLYLHTCIMRVLLLDVRSAAILKRQLNVYYFFDVSIKMINGEIKLFIFV